MADYQLGPSQALFVSGSLPQLGQWQADQMLQLTGETRVRKARGALKGVEH